MNTCRKFGFVICFMSLFVVSAVQAQEVIDPRVYTEIKKNLELEKLLEGRDPRTLSPEELHKLLVQTASATSIPALGSITGQDGIYVVSSGQSGEALGMIPQGEYEVFTRPIQNVAIIMPRTILVASRTGVELSVSMTEPSFLSKLYQKLVYLMPFFQKKNTSVTQPVSAQSRPGEIRLKLFQDTNKNGIREQGEKTVPWANVKVGLRKISHEEQVSLQAGENQLLIPAAAKNIQSAQELMTHILTDDRPPQSIRILDPMRFPQSIAYQNGVIYGTDFHLERGNTYFVTIPQEATVTFIEE